VIYLRAVQGIPLGRLRDALLDLFGLSISEGALVNKLSASASPFKTAVSLIKARLLGGTAIASDETNGRVGCANWWLWVFHHGDSAVFVSRKAGLSSSPPVAAACTLRARATDEIWP